MQEKLTFLFDGFIEKMRQHNTVLMKAKMSKITARKFLIIFVI